MPNAILTRAIDALAQRRDLSADETAEVLDQIMHGEASETQIAGFLIALRTKGETVDELTGLARTMRELAAHVSVDRPDLLDTAGTGGGASTFNVSTTAALIAAGAGCAVAKHGNRSATSRSGSADLLARRPESPSTAGSPQRSQRTEPAGTLRGFGHGPSVRQQALGDPRGSQPRDDHPTGSGEAPLPQRCTDQRDR